MIFAIDFDGTIVEDKFPDIGTPIPAVQEFIRKRKAQGDKFILWTCRTEQYLKEAMLYCQSVGIEFDAVNTNLPEIQNKYGGDTRKVFADCYIDDRNAILVNDLGMHVFPVKLIGEAL